MGSLLGLCIPDGQPCSGSEAVARRANKRGQNPSKQRLIDSVDSTASDSSIRGALKHESSREISIYTVPTKKIAIAPVISQHILLNEKFIEIRKRMEEDALKSEDIDTVLYRKDFWLIQGPDAIALEDHRDLFDIVIWRVPTIPAFAHFSTEEEFYDKILNETEHSAVEGIWSVLSKERFIQLFDVQLLKEIDEIKDETHSYLADEVNFPSSCEEYKILIEKLKVIEVWKKANDIVIVGQKTCVQDMLRIIRQQEVEHSSMLSMFKLVHKKRFEWEIKCDDDSAPDPNMIVSYSIVVSNLPLQCGQPQVHEILLDYSRWTYADIVRDNDEDIRKYRDAKIEFDDEKCLTSFIQDIERGTVQFGGNKVSIKSHSKEIKQRKTRRFNAYHMRA